MKRKRRPRKKWKRMTLISGGNGVSDRFRPTVNASFAEWVGGIFSTEQVDEGLRIATDADLTERVNLEIADNGLRLK